MFKKGIFVMIILLTAGLSGCHNDHAVDAQIPDDFNFTLSFGINGMSNIDTYNGTFTKDLVSDGTETITFVIPAEKIQEIYNMFEKCKISKLPDDINAHAMESIGENARSHTPADYYTLTYTKNHKTRTITCNDGGPWDARKGPPDAHKQLVQFINYVCEYIFSTNEYQQMSPAIGAYS